MRLHKFKPKHKRNTLVLKVSVIVSALMTLLAITCASIIVQQIIAVNSDDLIGTPPPPPNKQEVKRQNLVLDKRKKRTSANVKRINVNVTQKTVLPDVNITLPSGLGGTETGAGIGEGVELAGLNLTGLNITVPTMDIFGAKAKSDRVFIAFEASEETMRDDMGGLDAYNIVKNEIKNLIRIIPATTVFNIEAFDTHARNDCRETCFTSLVPANEANKATFERWIAGINADEKNFGIENNRDKNPRKSELRYSVPPYVDIDMTGSHYQNNDVVGRYRVYQSAIESGAGAIWILTRMWPSPDEYLVPLTPEQKKRFYDEWDKNVKDYERTGQRVETQEDWNNWIKATQPVRQKAQQWLEEENKKRAAKGIPKRVQSDMLALANELKYPIPQRMRPRDSFRPPQPRYRTYTVQSMLAAYEPILKTKYDSQKLPRPTVNIIMLLSRNTDWDNKKNAKVKAWTQANGSGEVRVVRSGKPVAEYN